MINPWSQLSIDNIDLALKIEIICRTIESQNVHVLYEFII